MGINMTSKITNAGVLENIKEMRANTKERKFQQTVELQIGLKDYDPQKDKRFVGTVRLPNVPRPKLKICLIADQKHADEVAAAGLEIEVTSLDNLKKFNKDKKQIKKWAKQFSLLIATDNLVKKIPVVCGPTLNRIGMFPQPVTHAEPISKKVEDIKASVKWQLKKVVCLNVAAGHEGMTDEQLRANLVTALNFLASLTKKGWQNIKSVNMKMTMGPAVKLL